MDAPNVNMLSEAALQELLDIRRQITVLQQRYDAIMRAGTNSAAAVVQAAPPAAPASPQPAPAVTAAPKPAPAAAPVTRPVAPAPAQPRRTPAPVAAPSPRPAPAAAKAAAQPAEVEQQPVKVSGNVTSNVREAIVNILAQAGKPLPFNLIYARLESSGVPMPEAKPMLVVRKLLHDTSVFEVAQGGLFQLKTQDDGAAAGTAEPTAAALAPAQPAPEQQAPAPTPAAPAPAVAVTPNPVQPAAAAAVKPAQSASFSARLDAILNK